MIANDLFTNNGIKNNPFGITIPGDPQNGYGENISGNMRSLNTSHPVINGPFGVVRQINFHNGSYFTIDPTAGTQAIAWQGFSHSVSTVIAAVAPYGQGWFALVGDSSPVDDGTGSPHDKLYDGWGEADDGIFLMNLIDFMRTH